MGARRKRHVHWVSVDNERPEFLMECMDEPGFELITMQPHEWMRGRGPNGYDSWGPVSWLLVYRSFVAEGEAYDVAK